MSVPSNGGACWRICKVRFNLAVSSHIQRTLETNCACIFVAFVGSSCSESCSVIMCVRNITSEAPPSAARPNAPRSTVLVCFRLSGGGASFSKAPGDSEIWHPVYALISFDTSTNTLCIGKTATKSDECGRGFNNSCCGIGFTLHCQELKLELGGGIPQVSRAGAVS